MLLNIRRGFLSAGRPFLLSLSLIVCICGTALAQVPGQKEAEQEKRDSAAVKELSNTPVPPVKPASPAAAVADGPRVLVRSILFSGQSVFNEKQLNGIIAADLNRQLSLADLKLLAARVAAYYHDQGYFLAQVLIPQQDIKNKDGAVKFLVFEGKLGQINIVGNKRCGEQYIRRAMSAVQPGKPIRRQDIERALRVLNESSGIKVSSVLRAGKDTGTTDVTIEVTEQNEMQSTLEINNFDLKSTDRYRLMPKLLFPNLSGRGDALDLSVNVTPETGYTNYGQISHVMPLGSRGLQLKTFASGGRFEVAREFAVLDIKGDNMAWGIGLAYPHLLTAAASKGYEAWLESRDSEQSMLGITTSKDQIRKLRLAYNVDTRDGLGRTFYSFGVHQGLGESLGGMPSESTLSSRSFARADNDFTKVTSDLTRVQRVNSHLYLIGRLSGQYSFLPLVAGEQWSIGGANSVRGHVQSTYLGDDGFTANLEGRLSLSPDNRYQLAMFVDHGQIHIKKPLLGQENTQSLSGMGLGIRASVLDSLDLRLDWGVPLGQNTGNDSLLYAQTVYSF